MTSLPLNVSSTADNLGPVTKLAAIAAAKEEKARIKKRLVEQANLQTTASLVGETALAIAAARASGSPIRLSPVQQKSIVRNYRTEPPKLISQTSVAARARAATDLPSSALSRTAQPPLILATRSPAAPSSGNTDVERGSFPESQVDKVVAEWGRDDTSNVDADYYDDCTSDSSMDNEGNVYFKQTSFHGVATASTVSNSRNNDDFHSQHHRVSAIPKSNNCPKARRNTGYLQGRNPNSERFFFQKNRHASDKDDSGGIFASAMSYFTRQREWLHHLELERQVEDQRRRLVGMGKRQHTIETDRWFNSADASNNNTSDAALTGAQPCEIAANSSLACLDDQPGREETGELCPPPEQGTIVAGMPDICGFGRAYAHQSDDSTDYSGVAR